MSITLFENVDLSKLLNIDPPLPPIKSKGDPDRRPRRTEPFFMPSIIHVEQQEREIWKGMYTIRYKIMNLWDTDYMTVSPDDDQDEIRKIISMNIPIVRTYRVGTDEYHKALDKWHPKGEVLPHIVWG